jgi:2,3-bisphosphoglycerate-dependent phosphoglycerate mutase
MTTIWLARHAETATPYLVHGAESDIGLGEHGRRQAAAVAPWFRELAPNVVVSSGMIRAVDTAAPIAAACGVTHEIEPELHERKVGRFSQKTGAEVDTVWIETTRRWEAGEIEYAYPGMESFAQISGRVVPAFQRVVARHTDKRVVIIAHGIVCKVLLLNILSGYGPADWTRLGRALNLSVSELVPDGTQWRANMILAVPSPVATVNMNRVDVGGKKTEA